MKTSILTLRLFSAWHWQPEAIELDASYQITAVRSEEARLRAGLRPPLKLHVQVSRMQLSQRLSVAGMTEKELS